MTFFVNRAKLQAQKCDFSADKINERLLELVIAGTPDPDFQKSLLSKVAAFTLEDALKLGRTYEVTAAHVKDLKDMQTSVSVETIKYRDCNNLGEKKKNMLRGNAQHLEATAEPVERPTTGPKYAVHQVEDHPHNNSKAVVLNG